MVIHRGWIERADGWRGKVCFQSTFKCVHSSDNLPSYPPDNHHSSDDVYRRRGGTGETKANGLVGGVNCGVLPHQTSVCNQQMSTMHNVDSCLVTELEGGSQISRPQSSSRNRQRFDKWHFCATVCPVTRTVGILKQSVKSDGC